MSQKCWDLNPNCMAKAEGEAKQPCPAFEQKIGCWELDWEALLQKAPAEQKDMMGQWVKENCPKCPVYSYHQEKIDMKIKTVSQ